MAAGEGAQCPAVTKPLSFRAVRMSCAGPQRHFVKSGSRAIMDPRWPGVPDADPQRFQFPPSRVPFPGTQTAKGRTMSDSQRPGLGLVRRARNAVANLNLMHKLVLSYAALIIMPQVAGYTSFWRDVEESTLYRARSETIGSLRASARSIDYTLERVMAAAFFLSSSRYVQDVLLIDGQNDQERPRPEQLLFYEKEEGMRDILANLSYSMAVDDVYLTILSLSGASYTNWPVDYSTQARLRRRFDEPEILRLPFQVHWEVARDSMFASQDNTRAKILSLILPVRVNSRNANGGVIIVSVPEAQLTRSFTPIEHGTQILLLDAECDVVASSLSPVFGQPIAGPADKEFLSSWLRDRKASVKRNRNTYIMLEQPVLNGQWHLLSIGDQRVELALTAGFRNRFVILNGSFLLLFLLVVLLMARNVASPLTQLSLVMKNYRPDGDFALTPSDRRDEIGVLQQMFLRLHGNILSLLEANRSEHEQEMILRLEALQAQINPHFIFNTLSSIRWALINGHHDKGEQMTFLLTKLLRKTLSTQEHEAALHEELDSLHEYISIMSLRSEQSFSVRIEVDDAVRNCLVPKMVMQPIVENSLLHGLDPKSRDGVVMISARPAAETRDVAISIYDNGRGIAGGSVDLARDDSSEGSSRVGLANVHQRIRILYGDRYGLSVRTRPEVDGTLVQLLLPFRLGGRRA